MQMIETIARIIHVKQLNPQSVVLTLEAPLIAILAKPGQFVNMSCNRFLRRPIGIMDADPVSGQIKVGIRAQGDGTRWLAQQPVGSTVSLLGPLGNGFNLKGFDRIITVGGGTGVFPLHFAQRYCREQNIEGLAVCGYRSTAESILTEEYADLACQTLFASDSGDMDFDGNAGKALEYLLSAMRLDLPPTGETSEGLNPPGKQTVILACGPQVMMQAVADIAARFALPCQVSLEERMACGIGVCLVCACAIKTAGGGEAFTHQRCCIEGPVFSAEVVQWSI
jgi:dihydroorotate dehydrogenase electron transfer subunit